MSTYQYDATKWQAIGIGNRILETDSILWEDGQLHLEHEMGGLLVAEDDTFLVLRHIPQESRPVSDAHPDAGEWLGGECPMFPLGAPSGGGVLPACKDARKGLPIATGFLDYFPLAVAAVAELSRVGNEQHNPGKPLHWDRSKSGDEADALMRHFLERGTTDTDGIRHSTKVAWRAMALLQKELEASK